MNRFEALPFDVAVVRSNPISRDPRALKIVRSLSKKYRTVVLGWDREGVQRKHELVNDRVSVWPLKLRAPYGKATLVLYYPFFWIWVFIHLVMYRPKFIHACDLDSAVPCYAFRMLFATRLVFDSFDRYALAFIPLKYHSLHTFVDELENLLAGRVDALITVSEERLRTFGKFLPRNSEVIMNCPEPHELRTPDRASGLKMNYSLLLVQAGGMAHRGLPLLQEAIEDLDVKLVLAGNIEDIIDKRVLDSPNIEFVGRLGYDEALKLQGAADIIPICYDPSIPNNLVANPNKLFEAMMLGVPVIANVCKEIVTKVACGLTVEYNSNSIRDAILRLKNDRALRRKMGGNGRHAFEASYNWPLMEKRLLALYDKLSVER